MDAVEEATKRDDGYDESQRGPGGVKYAEGLGGQPNVSGSTTSQGYSGGPTKKKDHDGGEDSVSKSDHKSSASGSENQSKNDSTSPASETKKQSKDDNKSEGNTASSAGVAPTYINDVYLGELGKPKGKNLIEDENLEGDRKTDFEIGSKDDPGRAAVEGFENSNTSELQSGVDKENPYSELQGDDDRA